MGNPNYNGHFYSFQNTDMSNFESAGGAGGTDETGTNKDAHQMPVKPWRTLHCVPAICDLLYSTSCALFPVFIIAVHGEQWKSRPIEGLLATFCIDVSAEF